MDGREGGREGGDERGRVRLQKWGERERERLREDRERLMGRERKT